MNGGNPGRVRVVFEQPVREHPAAERRPRLRALPAVGLAGFARHARRQRLLIDSSWSFAAARGSPRAPLRRRRPGSARTSCSPLVSACRNARRSWPSLARLVLAYDEHQLVVARHAGAVDGDHERAAVLMRSWIAS